MQQQVAMPRISGPFLSGNPQNNLVVKQEWNELENPAPRFPCIIVADCSSSMEGEPIRLLSLALQSLGSCVRENALAARSVEIAIVRVGEPLEILVDFTPADRFFPPTELQARGGTPLAEGAIMAIQNVEKRIRHYNSREFDHIKPMAIFISDGEPNNSDAIPIAISEVQRVERENLMAVYAVGINAEAAEKLQRFSVRKSINLKDMRQFDPFFRSVSRHIIKVSQSMPGEEPGDFDVSEANWT
jgi:uncharacterized protein YegL